MEEEEGKEEEARCQRDASLFQPAQPPTDAVGPRSFERVEYVAYEHSPQERVEKRLEDAVHCPEDAASYRHEHENCYVAKGLGPGVHVLARGIHSVREFCLFHGYALFRGRRGPQGEEVPEGVKDGDGNPGTARFYPRRKAGGGTDTALYSLSSHGGALPGLEQRDSQTHETWRRFFGENGEMGNYVRSLYCILKLYNNYV